MTTVAERSPLAIDLAGDFQANPVGVEGNAVRAESSGYDGVLVAETRHDPFVGLALAARATERITLASSIAVAFARSPMITAVLANDLQELSQGRFSLGLGSQVKAHIERRFSMPWSRPAARMEEYVRALRAIWGAWATGESLAFEGEFYRHTLMTPFFSPGPAAHGNPPVHLAGVGKLMTETAGAVADGFLCHTFTTPRYLSEVTLPALARGRARSELTAPVVISLPVFVATDDTQRGLDTALGAVRRQLAFYASTPAYRGVLETHGWESLHDRLLPLSRKGEWREMADEITDDVLHEFAVIGSPVEAAAQLRGRFAGVVDRLSFSTPYEVEDGLLEDLVQHLRTTQPTPVAAAGAGPATHAQEN